MGFQISKTGTRDGVAKAIQSAKTEQPADEQDQLKAAQVFILAEIKNLPAEFNGCRVDAHGGAHAGGRSIQVNIVPLAICT